MTWVVNTVETEGVRQDILFKFLNNSRHGLIDGMTYESFVPDCEPRAYLRHPNKSTGR